MRHRRHHDEDETQPPDNLTDIRALLPSEFREVPTEEVAELLVGWEAARHGHQIHYLTGVLGVPGPVAERLILLARTRAHDSTPSQP